MDPAQCLLDALEAARTADVDALRLHLDSYREWRAVQGFQPVLSLRHAPHLSRSVDGDFLADLLHARLITETLDY